MLESSFPTGFSPIAIFSLSVYVGRLAMKNPSPLVPPMQSKAILKLYVLGVVLHFRMTL